MRGLCFLALWIPALGYAVASPDGLDRSLGWAAFAQQDYASAAVQFQDNYRKGVAYYRAGQYPLAINAFEQVTRKAVLGDAQYNLGNTYFQLQAYEAAIEAYAMVLRSTPEHEDAAFNLALAQTMLGKSPDQQEDEPQKDEEAGQQQDQQTQSQSAESTPQNQQGKAPSGESSGANSEDDSAGESSDVVGEETQVAEQKGDAHAGATGGEDLTQVKHQDESPNGETPNDASPPSGQRGGKPGEKQAPEGARKPGSQPLQQLMQQTEGTKSAGQMRAQDNEVEPVAALSDEMVEQWLRRVDGEPSPLLRYRFFLEEARWQKTVSPSEILEIRPW